MVEEQLEKRIEKELTGEPIQAGEYILRPVAHVHASHGEREGESYAMTGAYVRLAPTALLVEGPDGDVQRIAIDDPTDRVVRNLVRVGALVAAVSVAAMLARRLARFVSA
jgi:uncharacterized spore protein YtfJ